MKPYKELLVKVVQECKWDLFQVGLPKLFELAEGDPLTELDICHQLIVEIGRTGHVDEARMLMERGLAIAQKDSRFEVWTYLLRGEYASVINDIDALLENGQAAMNCSEPLSEPFMEGQVLVLEAWLFEGRFSDVLRDGMQLLAHLNKSNSKYTAVCSALAIAHSYGEDFAKAEHLLQSALECDEKAGLKRKVARHLLNLAALRERTAAPHEAIVLYEKALEAVRMTDALEFESAALYNSSNLACRVGDFPRAARLGEEALELASRINLRHDVLKSHVNLGYIYLNFGELSKSIHHSTAAFQWPELLDGDEAVRAHANLMEAYELSHQTEQALEHAKLMAQAERLGNAKRATELVAYQSVLKAQLIESERKRHAMEKNRLNAELAVTTSHLVQQTELLSNFRNEMREILRRIPASLDENIGLLKNRLKELPCQTIDWKQFDAQYKLAHPEFLKKLSDRFPSLSQQELKICSLLKLRLRSAEISRLLCLSQRTIENHRYNIRRKLQLSSADEIAVLFDNL